ncbi:MAG: SDR family oxidoreductase [Betaproteobacteria bacterium]|jgi:3-oxoacyl-[acyl-carrier protein] reductase|nr:SDR family oxidoreductase [Pseudomonadota bacterium]NBO94989.1 SDR family oxidoreductase [Betaproteobacteria bacterium]HAB47881.1 3-oxoacyl-ACP reductase [Lautropia sp.]NBP36099.1 SDR family oxidoreductase [Betaproteobacteria bacterium]NBP37786.1 SDR family oxidoreductase [Betaproteobacteria bacterium]
MNQLDLKGRYIAVTGGASGIGEAIVNRLIASGASVIVWDTNQSLVEKLSALHEPHRYAIKMDVTDPQSVQSAMQASLQWIASQSAVHGSGLDGMICSAGITGPNHTVIDYRYDDWKHVFDVNLHGVFLCNQVAAQHMKSRAKGRIVNIASIAGKEGNPNASAYSASKAAVIGLTKSLGKELASSGVTVNCVTPAAVKTPMFSQMSETHIQFMLSKIPMNRFGLVEEIAAMVCWLCTDDASFSTGAVFDLSGGRATY